MTPENEEHADRKSTDQSKAAGKRVIPDPRNFPYNQRRRTGALTGSEGRMEEHPYQNQDSIQECRRKAYKAAKRLANKFHGNLRAYLGVNAVLVMIWLFGGAGFPWFFFPAGGWGIGIVSQLFTLKNKNREAKELQLIPVHNKTQLQLLRTFQKRRSTAYGNIVSAISISAYLMGINIITGGWPSWSLIPAGILLSSAFVGFSSFKRFQKSIFKKLSDAGISMHSFRKIDNKKLFLDKSDGSVDLMHSEAGRLHVAIMAKMLKMNDTSFLGENFEQVLDTYVNQIGELHKKEDEIGRILTVHSLTGMQQELLNLQRQHEKTLNADIKIELEKSISSIKRQQQSYHELQKQRELIKARLSAAINSLKQLQLDLTRMEHTSINVKPTDQLIAQTDEIHEYIGDLEAAYRRLEEREGVR